jgi:hypothetical protein
MPTNQNRRASASPSSPPFHEKKGGLVCTREKSTKMTVYNPINPPNRVSGKMIKTSNPPFESV